MDINSKIPEASGTGKSIIIILLIALILPIEASAPKLKNQEQINTQNLITIQENTLVPVANFLVIQGPKAKRVEPRVIRRVKMTITAYSSTPDQTDCTPFITAANTWVRKGIVANNFYPFGTKIRIPEFFGNKIFVVEDRMHWRKSNYHIDVWFPSRQEAINFGITRAYVEILK